MSLKYSYSLMFREFQFFSGAAGNMNDWSANSQNYAISDYGNKIAIVDTTAKKIYFVSMVNNGTTSEGVISTLKAKALNNQITDAAIASAIGTNAAYSYSIDLSKDGVYAAALLANPNLNSSVDNFASWVTALSEVGKSYLTKPATLSVETFTSLLFSDNARVNLYAGKQQGSDDINEAFMVSNANTVAGTQTWDVDGGGGYAGDWLTFSDTTQSERMSKGVVVNLNNATFTGSYVDSKKATVNVSIAANTAKFYAKSTAAATSETLYTVRIADISGNYGTNNLSSIENVAGTKFDDFLIGNSGTNTFDPGKGADIVLGFSDPNLYHGGDLNYKDRVSYWGDDGKGIVAVVSTTLGSTGAIVPMVTVTDTGGSTDILKNISYVVGSIYADKFTGADYDRDINPYRSEFSGLAGADTIDGHLTVRASYFFDPNGITVNLGSSDIKNSAGTIVKAGTVLDGFGSVDIVSKLFGIRGSDYSDLINMSSASEVVTGQNGDDIIYGNGGNDNLWGNGGDDIIVGGQGVDVMVGRSFSYVGESDSLPLNDIDVFKFLSVSDSAGGSLKSTDGDKVGDIILDFDVLNDALDFSKIDANAKFRGDQKFKIVTSHEDAFNKIAGQLIFKDATVVNNSVWASDYSKSTDGTTTSSSQSGVLIQGDVQGDGKADFSVFLVGVAAVDANQYLDQFIVF